MKALSNRTKRVQFKGGKFEKSTVERLVTVKEVRFKADLDQRAVRDRYNLLANKLRRKLKDEEKASGIETDMTELEAALEDLIEREDQSDAQHKENQEENIKKKEDRDVAKDMRKKSLQRIGETQKRKREEIQLSQVKKKKKRGSAGDAVAFLRERTEAMAAARKEEISMQVQQQESESKRHQEFLELMKQQQQQQHQQHQQMHSMQAMLLQQQQQQSQLMMALLSKLQDK
ncbi:PREDICTED: UPF0746 protein DDB_G0281095-like [Acropora digitifera]|uniref:UPF0746 protein DDB_G0281095-like n=1 Tax=Acropora digitifera TaxID=70779 RepID=UPI00077A76D4|nr:PREDICTED: UPF0746 protein DDB_G0281095-like [Acropora digitifera]